MSCLFGDKDMLTIDLKPLTVGVYILNINSGDSWAVALLTSYKIIKELISSCLLHKQVNYNIGLSSSNIALI